MKGIFSSCLLLLFLLPGNVPGQENRTTLDVNAPPEAFLAGGDGDVCRGDSVARYITFLGDGPFDAVINNNMGQYLVLNDVFGPQVTIWLKPNISDTYYIASVTDSNGDAGTTYGTASITVLNVTPVDIVLAKKAYFKKDSEFPLISNPPGGTFIGIGVSGGNFYPSLAPPEGSPHLITCTYTNADGCVSTDTDEIIVIHGISDVVLLSGTDTITTVCDDAGSYELRGSNLDNEPGTFQLFQAGLPISVPGHINDPDPLDNRASFDPIGLSGSYDLMYTYTIDVLTVNATIRLLVNDLGSLKINGLSDMVCSNDDSYLLYPDLLDSDPEATYLISGPGISGSQTDGYYFDPSSDMITPGENKIQMEYTSSNGCSSKVDTIVTVHFTAVADFLLSAVCLPADGGTVDFTNMTSSKDSVDSWYWNFGDPESGTANFSDLEEPSHFYEEPGRQIISLTAITQNGCESMHLVDTVLSVQPLADFAWMNNCYTSGGETEFMDRSVVSSSTIDRFIWTFKTADGATLEKIEKASAEDTVRYAFSSLAKYEVELQIESDDGCVDRISRELDLKPTISITQDGYLEQFNGNQTHWTVGSKDHYHSWILGTPDFTGFEPVEGDFAWYTSLPVVDTTFLEHSWIESPCFDFSRASRPLIQMDLMKSFAPSLDGVVLQYHEGTGGDWITLGTAGDGVNWYNATGIYNKPGGSSVGWGSPLTFNWDESWINARHSLDMLAGNPNAQIRVVIATGGKTLFGNQGFAFDNVAIAERVRRSVLEYFTNSSSLIAKEADDLTDSFSSENSANLIDLQYHMDYPGVDPMNVNNPYPPETRSFHFGVPGVPYAVLNGGMESDQRYDFSNLNHEPKSSVLKKASLEIPLFELRLNVDWMEDGLEATAQVTCIADTFTSNIQLYMAVIETTVSAYIGINQDTSFRNVVLDMLPTPAGKLLGNEWNNGKTESRSFTWNYPEYVEDIEDLAVVAFVQDRDLGSILQATAKYLTPQVDITPRRSSPGSLVVFPNPARDHLFVRIDQDKPGSGQIRIMDLSGKVVKTSEIQSGYSIQRLDISNLPQGIYLIGWFDGGVLKARNKMVRTR